MRKESTQSPGDRILIVTGVLPSELVPLLSEREQRAVACRAAEIDGIMAGRPFDIVVLDGRDAEDDALEVLRRLKVGYPRVPVIFLSGGRRRNAAVEAFRAGARDFYDVPVNALELRENVSRLLSLRHISREGRRPLVRFETGIPTIDANASPGLPPGVMKAVAFMEGRVGDDLSLGRLAEVAGMSKYHFCREFKKHMKSSPVRYLDGLRMERARTLLSRGTLNVSAVAAAVGYNDLSHFCRKFREANGTSPTGYIKATFSGDPD